MVELAEVRARDSADPRRAHLKYVYTQYPKLHFPVVNMFALGSPIAVFLLVRRQHQALHQDFMLARCLRMYNIFHPYDPVAYRWVWSRGCRAEGDVLPCIGNDALSAACTTASRRGDLPESTASALLALVRILALTAALTNPACVCRLEPFINARDFDREADILPTWQGKYRVHYQVSQRALRHSAEVLTCQRLELVTCVCRA